MKKIGIIIQARLGSSRLPNKVLLPLGKNKDAVIIFLIKRLKEYLNLPIYVAIPDNHQNDILFDLLISKDFFVFRGSENNVLSRFYNCAKENNLNTIVRLTADCPLVNPKTIIKMLETFNIENIDYLSNTTPLNKSTFPDGSDIEIFSYNAISKSFKNKYSKRYLEHVTFQFWNSDNKFISEIFKKKLDTSHLRYTLDNFADYEVIMKIIDYFYINKNIEMNEENISNFLENNLNIREINSMYKQGDNW